MRKLSSIIWILTGKCNLNCKHCYAKRFLDPNKWGKEVDKEDVLNVMLQAVELGLKWTNFSGGELLLFKPWVLDILAELNKHGVDVSLVTNGMFIDNEKAEFMSKNNIFAYVSLDGNRKTHEYLRGPGTWDITLNGIMKLREKDVEFATVMAVGRHNYNVVKDFVKISKELGASHVAIIPIMPFGNALKNKIWVKKNEYLEALEQFVEALETYDIYGSAWCTPWAKYVIKSKLLHAGNCRKSNGMDIGPDGWTLLCDVLDYKINYVLGRPLEEVWEEYNTHPLVRRVSEPPRAYECPFYDSCMGGCFARALSDHETFEGDPLCPFYKGIRQARVS